MKSRKNSSEKLGNVKKHGNRLGLIRFGVCLVVQLEILEQYITFKKLIILGLILRLWVLLL